MLNVSNTKTRKTPKGYVTLGEAVSKSRAKAVKAAAEVEANVLPLIEQAVKKGRAKTVAAPVTPAPVTTPSVTKPDGTMPRIRPTSKRAAIVNAWIANNRITLDEVAAITGWSKAVNSSELFQIATIFGRKIARNGAGEYQFLLD
jgi:hypothetical protein